MHDIIYTTVDRNLVVTHDEPDVRLPISVRIGSEETWLSKDEADQLVDSIAAALHVANPANVAQEGKEPVLASEVSFNEGAIRLAAVHGRAVAFRYTKSDTAPVEHRHFVPSEVKRTQDGNVVFVGHDEDREAPRSFRLDRIRGDVSVMPS